MLGRRDRRLLAPDSSTARILSHCDCATDNGIPFTISGPDVCIKFATQNQPGDTGGLAELMIGWQHVHTIPHDLANDDVGTAEQLEATGGMGPGGAPGPASGAAPEQ
ncbi:hypothetical protein GCM10009767_20420 [Kocuria aegyptia]|uniref:Uncharacterized protein n=1 Tax=Kocuria aegyptia TaxID=330943 RepID=A0ABN2KQR7_9MICC